MKTRRPVAVLIIGIIYIAVGAIGLVAHAIDFKNEPGIPYDTLLVEAIELLAIVSGAYMLAGKNWARWFALAWMAFHVGLSAFHNMRELLVHAVMLTILAFFLLRSSAARYFQQADA